MGIGAVMFGKAIVIAVWIIIVERWDAYRKRRHETGLPLKQNRKTGVYEVSDWTVWINRTFLAGKYLIFALGLLWWAALSGTYLYGGPDLTRQMILWLLNSR